MNESIYVIDEFVLLEMKLIKQESNWQLLITIIILEGNLQGTTKVTYVFIEHIEKGLSDGMLYLFWRKSHIHIYRNYWTFFFSIAQNVKTVCIAVHVREMGIQN